MDYRKVTALISPMALESVELALVESGVPGVTVSTTKGYGEYRNYYTRDLMSDCVRVEVFAEADRADQVARIIAHAAHTGVPGDGIVAVLPVDTIYHIREFDEAEQAGPK